MNGITLPLRLPSRWTLSSLSAILICSVSRAQAPASDWASGFEAPGFDDSVYAVAQFDDGNGPAVYVGGNFSRAGAANAPWIARWDGTTWSAVGEGFSGYVKSLAVFDDGTGPALYVGGDQLNVRGQFAGGIARWNGSAWSTVGTSTIDPVWALAVYDDGLEPALYAGGENHSFSANVAKWDGASWTPLGSGCTGGDGVVNSLAVFDDGTGPALAAGGDFIYAGGVAAQNVARWNGSAWSPIDIGLYGATIGPNVRSLTVADVGSGPSLFASGEFRIAGVDFANHIARWDGTYWRALAEGLPAGALAIRGYAGNLYAGGSLGAGPFLRRWNGNRWSNADAGDPDRVVLSLNVADDGEGPQLYAGGSFQRVGSLVGRSLVRLGPNGWNGIFQGKGLGDEAYCSTIFDRGYGNELYVGGRFHSAGPCVANAIARWDGTTWSPLEGDADGYVFAIAASSHGPGGVPELYAGGIQHVAGSAFTGNLGRWDGTGWSSPGGGLTSSNSVEVDALFITDFGPGPGSFLYAGGYFEVAGAVPAWNIARWDGSSWAALGSGVGGQVRTMTMFDDGSGPALYVGGYFSTAGGIPAEGVAKWDGLNWSALGSGISGGYGSVRALAVFDDGLGPALFVSGDFASAGGIPSPNIARWNGSSWSSVPGLLFANGIDALVVHDDGHGGGPALYASGGFSADPFSRAVERWTGSHWETLRTGIAESYGIDPYPRSMSVGALGNASAPSLYVVGSFHTAGLKASDYIAEWTSVPSVGSRYCTGDGHDPRLTIACPCGNVGENGRGCASGVDPAGAALDAVGSVLADASTGTDSVQLIASGMDFDGTSLFLQASANVHGGTVLGDGVRCVGGVLRRIGVKRNLTGAARYPEPGETSLSRRGNVVLGSGATRFYQVLYRDSVSGFCRPLGLNLTNGLRIVW